MTIIYKPELLYANGRFRSRVGLLVGEDGHVLKIVEDTNTLPFETVAFPGKALLPGFINAHSHSFQRLIRGKAESAISSGQNFWSWRETMYYAARHLTPEDVYDVSRMAFLEMALAGTTTVGEFHYLHNAPDGEPYEDPNLLGRKVIAGAGSVGLRIRLLRVAYLRSGYRVPTNPGQIRFFETAREFLENMASLLQDFPNDCADVWVGVAPHSIRAVPLDDLGEIVAWSRDKRLPVHMHVAEQLAEVSACEREYGYSPVRLFARYKLLGPDFTAVHVIHTSPSEIDLFGAAGGIICSCPTAERNLGDGIFAADQVLAKGIRVALGSDNQAQIDPLEDARSLDYHLRLTHKRRVILGRGGDQELSTKLFQCATSHGAQALGFPGGEIAEGKLADFFTVDLSDPCIAGNSCDDLLSLIVFGLNRVAICDVAVGGKLIVQDHRHPDQQEIISRYKEVYRKVWPGTAIPLSGPGGAFHDT